MTARTMTYLLKSMPGAVALSLTYDDDVKPVDDGEPQNGEAVCTGAGVEPADSDPDFDPWRASTDERAERDDTQAQQKRVPEADIELERVLTFIDRMPTWHVGEVHSVKNWLAHELGAHKHRN